MDNDMEKTKVLREVAADWAIDVLKGEERIAEEDYPILDTILTCLLDSSEE